MKRCLHTPLGAALLNMLVAYVVMMLSRVAFFIENWATFAPYMSWELLGNLLRGAWVFDTSALLYLNSLYLALTLLPLHLKERPTCYQALRWLYVVTNGIGVGANLVDAVYFKYTGRRTTATIFNEFSNESNLTSIIGIELLHHWYLVLAFFVFIAILWRCFTKPQPHVYRRPWHYYLSQVLAIIVAVPLAIIGIRGSATAGTRPITINNANQYVNRPIEAALVLNTPFSIIRSIGKATFEPPSYFAADELEAIYSPIHRHPVVDSLSRSGRNVVILIVESMGKEYIGTFNHELDSGTYRGYMPFVDSLVAESYTFAYSYANGRKSMDAMPSLLCGLPMMVEPLFTTPAALNAMRGLPAMLDSAGYTTAFFHGGHNLSMGFSAFARHIGFQHYYGLNQYCQSQRHGGMNDWDGKWAIWDEPFLQYMLDELEQLPQPFLAAAFTATSHHPYNLPEAYRHIFLDEGGQPIHKCVRYTDMALRRFFARASHEPWFSNTVFVLVADHTSLNSHRVYQTDLGLYSIPIIFYTPDGTLPPTLRTDAIAQQTDVTPTLLHLLGIAEPYLAFGCDLLATPAADTWAISYNSGTYQLVKGDWLLQFDGQHVKGLYRFKTDPLLTTNLTDSLPAQQQGELKRLLQAIIQQYMTRMSQNHLLP